MASSKKQPVIDGEGDGLPRAKSLPADARRQLAEIDRKIIALAEQRTALCAQLVASHAPAEIAAALARSSDALAENAGDAKSRALAAMLRELNSAARAAMQAVRVVYLGPEFSYSHLAAIARFGHAVELVPVGTIEAVFEEVEQHQAELGVVPLENSTDGRISDTLDNFARRNVEICGEVPLEIHHNLLGRGPRSEIRVVQSKPQALSQCRNWLAKHLPAARIEEVTSTTAAAQRAAEANGVAAVASRQAAVNYGLDILAANIEDNPSNVTRFAVLGDHAERRTGDDKTSLMFELAHKSGALADAITVLKRHRVNLTWLESFPMSKLGKDSPEGGYLFFVEFVGHRDDARVRRALASLAKKAKRLVVLGSYARRPAVE
jgi:chorismate mutase/prephenate dehydratase